MPKGTDSKKPMPTTVFSKKNRPLGIVIIAALAAIFGITAILGSLLSLLLFHSSFFTSLLPLSGRFTSIAAIAAAVIILIAILNLLLAYGLYNGKKWGWWLGIILGILYILSIFMLNILGLIAGIILVVYLTRKEPKEYFG